jgi:hypothetical protein
MNDDVIHCKNFKSKELFNSKTCTVTSINNLYIMHINCIYHACGTYECFNNDLIEHFNSNTIDPIVLIVYKSPFKKYV